MSGGRASRRVFRLGLVLLVLSCVDGPAAPADEDGDGNGQEGEYSRDVPERIELVRFVDSLRAHMPGAGSNGYSPPTPAERAGMLDLIERALRADLRAADSLAQVWDYDVESTVETTTNDTLIVIVERAPIRRGWGTYVLNRRGILVDVHVNHPVFDVFTPAIAAAFYRDCRCRALLMAGTHRYANPDDISDMARTTTSLFQAVHQRLAPDAVMAVSVHGFATFNHPHPTSASDVVLSSGATSAGVLAAVPSGRDLRDRLNDAGFVTGLVADDPGYTTLTGEPNPQGRWSNDHFGHGRWLHVELAETVRAFESRWRSLAGLLAHWAADLP